MERSSIYQSKWSDPFTSGFIFTLYGMRKTRRKQLAECNSSKTTRRKQLVENKGRKTGRKLTRRMIIKCKLVEYLQDTHWDDSVLIMI